MGDPQFRPERPSVLKLRNLIWLTPVAPSGPPVTGAGTPVQVPPPLSVRAIEVQYWVAQWPGVLAWPITQPVCVPMNVTEVGRKLAGTGAGSDAGRRRRPRRGRR